MKNKLQTFIESMEIQERELLLGSACEDSLRYAFKGKRTTHAGVGGKTLSPDMGQNTWTTIMQKKRKIKGKGQHM